MFSTYLTDKFGAMTRRLTNIGSGVSTINNSEGGFASGILFGGLIAIIWTPCAGPILATIIVQTVTQTTTLLSFLTVAAFGLGAAIPMLAIALFGRQMTAKLGFLKTQTSLLRKGLGVVIILSVVLMIYLDNGISATPVQTQNRVATHLENAIDKPYPAPEISGITAWINSAPLEIRRLKGRVVLIDFWTYSCINCLRTLPYLNAWYAQYHKDGLEIIGVHTPEFDFEKDVDNVKNAVNKTGIKYPVALDNSFTTWQNFMNRYWPAHYLINQKGEVVYTHFGEGDYEATENNIRYLLNINKPKDVKINNQSNRNNHQTPETYLGSSRAEHFASVEPVLNNQMAKYTFPKKLSQNDWALQGSWITMPDRIISGEKNAELRINFNAQKVYVVMGNATSKNITVEVLLNGNPINKNNKGKDVENGHITVLQHTLYEVIELNEPSNGVLEIRSSSQGLEIYAFTFG